MASSNRRLNNRDDYKRLKELEEARKAGTVPPQVDEEGRDINPHIPEYVKESPWYLELPTPSLKHQRSETFEKKTLETETNIYKWYTHGKFAAPPPTKYRRGACTNCGAMTHTAKCCTERPRRVGCKWSGRSFCPDELIQDIEFDYASKRDQWNGYDPERYREVVAFYEKMEASRIDKRAREEVMKTEDSKCQKGAEKTAQAKDVKDAASGKEDPIDDFRAADHEDNVGQFAKIDAKSHRSVRDLRIREDVSKYLLNINDNETFYDPKSRSMRANPYGDADPEDARFKGDNWHRFSGDTKNFYDVQRFVWEESERGNSVHLQAAPSEAAMHYKKHREQSEKEGRELQERLIAEYGGEEHMKLPPEQILFGTKEAYAEYTVLSTAVVPPENLIPRSKYQEDVYDFNHTSVFGSWWSEGKWGYKCCHQTIKNAYCRKINLSKKEPSVTTPGTI